MTDPREMTVQNLSWRNTAVHRIACVLAGLAVLLTLSFVSTATAHANLTFEHVGFGLTGPDGKFSRQAGAHPDFTTEIDFPLDPDAVIDGRVSPGPPEAAHDVEVDLPSGFVGNPQAVETCDPVDLANTGSGGADCPVGAQIGVAYVDTLNATGSFPFTVAIFNLSHGPDVPARFGFNYSGSVAVIDARIRPGDYGISSGSFAISEALAIQSIKLTFWGVPADPSHDAERSARNVGIDPTTPVSSQLSRAPFLSLPTSCNDTPASFTIRGDSWENRGAFDTRTLTADEGGTPFVFDGCESLPFAPKAVAQPTTRSAGSPSGFNVDLEVPQVEDPDGLRTADVRKVVTTLPEGMTVSPSSASGLGSCAQAEIGLDSIEAPNCPESSKLGTVAIKTPLLADELKGSVYLAQQGANPFGSLLAMYIAVEGPGFWIKLPGQVSPDSQTGRLTVTFSDTPQLPFERLHLALKEGPRAALTTPSACGTYTTRTEFTSWAQPDNPVISDSSFTIDEGCGKASRFDPGLSAGTISPAAGSYSPFVVRVTRQDGEENLSRIQATLPEGVLAKLAGVTRCSDAAAAAGNCPASSQVGTTTVGTGSGPNPLYVPEAGKSPTAIYLAGPYNGAPYSLVVKVPAQAGPFDLGTVVVRNALFIDPVTARVTAKSDPLPQLLQGIPLSYRDVRVEINRDKFTINPTNCEAMQVTSTLTSSQGASAHPSDRFQAANCATLGFKPKLRLALKGKVNRSAHPSLHATLTARRGDANIAAAQVKLPKSAFLDQAHIKTVCTRVQFAARACPPGSIYGRASATSPLVDFKLAGPVYLRSSNHPLPDLVAELRGPDTQPITVELSGKTDAVKGALRNTFGAVPDVPVAKFSLTLFGGRKGLIEMSDGFCAHPRASVRLAAQNGKSYATNPKVKGNCGTKTRSRKG
jgi:hypothetical protein